MKPIELLQKQLDEYIRARDKSITFFKKNEIDEATHDKHIANLTPKIEEYRFAIKMLEKYT